MQTNFSISIRRIHNLKERPNRFTLWSKLFVEHIASKIER